jgi:uncharacterized membrane protein YoaK (UPF0700 family)
VRSRDAALIALTVLTGATDAIAFLSLGGVFTSVMTGNMVLLGVGIGRGELGTITHTLVALTGYLVGAIAGGAVAGKPRPGDLLWPRVLTLCLCAELALYVLYSVLWWRTGDDPSPAMRSLLLCLLATALGLQSSAVLRLGLPGFSTTYLTGTLTQVMSTLAANRNLRGVEQAIGCLVALIAGAMIGAAGVLLQPAVGPAVLLMLIGAVVAVALLVLNRPPTRAPGPTS